MATKTKETPKVETAPEEPKRPRIDERGENIMVHLGFMEYETDENGDKQPMGLPVKLVETYMAYKRVKDKIRPGPLSAEAYAYVVELYRLRVEIGL